MKTRLHAVRALAIAPLCRRVSDTPPFKSDEPQHISSLYGSDL
jgi:hypothetical protein